MQGMLVMKRLPWEPSPRERQDATFVLQPGLLCRAGAVSLEAAAHPGQYIKLDRAAGASSADMRESMLRLWLWERMPPLSFSGRGAPATQPCACAVAHSTVVRLSTGFAFEVLNVSQLVIVIVRNFREIVAPLCVRSYLM